MPLSDSAQKFWDQYAKTQPEDLDLADAKVEASMAGNKEITDRLIDLYLIGKKTAGSGLVKDYQLAGDELPKVGDYWIALDSKQVPKCILKTVRVEICQFDKVGEHVAIAEGEGDMSLDYWREGHRRFFAPYLKEWKISDLGKEDVVTEFYKLVYK